MSANLSASPAGGVPAYGYAWTAPGCTIVGNGTPNITISKAETAPVTDTISVGVTLTDSVGSTPATAGATVTFVANLAALAVVISPNPNTQHAPGGGTCTFTENATITSGDDGSCTYLWTTGSTTSSTTFTAHAPPSDQVVGTVGVTVTRHSDGATASGTADWFADGF